MSARAIFFDLDGTLADTRADIAATVNHTRREFDLAPLDPDVILSYVGEGARKLLERSIPETSADTGTLLRVFMAHYDEHATENVRLYPGVEATLDELLRRGWRLGINTAKPRSATELIVAKFGLERFFGKAVVAGGDACEMKPSAVPLRLCAERMGHVVTPADWMVGDNWTDIACADNAGVGSVYCSFGFGIRKGLASTATIASFGELPDVCRCLRF